MPCGLALFFMLLAPGGRQSGHVAEFDVPSRILATARHVWIYTPASLTASDTVPSNLLVAFDGADYTTSIPLPAILDSLIAAGKIPPTVAVLIENGSGSQRIADLGNRAQFAKFVTDELIPWVRQRYRVTTDAHRTVITGSSAGGLAAAYLALKRPDLFGNVLSQSGAFWRGNEGSNSAPWEYLATAYATAPRHDVRFLLDVGSLEASGALGGAAPSILQANRHLRDVLTRKGYTVIYTEVPGGQHSPESWKTRLPGDLVQLMRGS